MLKNLLTLVALFVSVSGIAVSLAREEVRCYLGLESSECGATRPNSPRTPAPQPLKEVVKDETTPPEPEPPLEVTPTPEPPQESISIPLEVIPAPEQ